jgi:peptidoglycan/LPS O-acetylase OafA/YrhL
MRETREFRHINALDGIRGLAVIPVFLYHASISTWTAISTGNHNPVGELLHGIAVRGWAGVDLFFILSGYLITSILLRAKDRENYYQVFYARRALRILPLYYLVMFGLISWHWPPIKDQIWFWFNISNFPTAFSPPFPILSLSHYWSLAIEEQFYLLWPAMVRRFDERVLTRICLGAIVVCFALRNLPIVLSWNQRWPNFIYRLTPFRIDTLCAGALLAILMHRGVKLGKYRNYLRISVIAGATILAISGNEHNLPDRWAYSGTLLCFTALIALALDPAHLTARFFGNRFLRRMGLYSYCFYLIHTAVLTRVTMIVYPELARCHLAFADQGLNHLTVDCIAFAVTFALCAASYKFFESPILNLKRFFPYRARNAVESLPAVAS